MLRFLLRRFAELVVVFFGVTFVIYAAVFALPGDPVAALGGDTPLPPRTVELIRAKYHLDDPLWSQYLRYLGTLLSGDLGVDLNGRSVAERLAGRWPVTIQLALSAWVVQVVLGVGLGLVAGLRQNSWLDRGVLIMTIVITSIPIIVMAVAAQLIFGVRLSLFPIAGVSDGWPVSYVLPACVLAVYGLAAVSRLMRGSVADTMRTDFVRALWAKGLPAHQVVGVHVLRNSAIPVITVLGLHVGRLLGGSIVIESVAGISGLGTLAIQAILQRDYPTIQGYVLFSAVIVVLVNLAVDLLYGWINPKVRA